MTNKSIKITPLWRENKLIVASVGIYFLLKIKKVTSKSIKITPLWGENKLIVASVGIRVLLKSKKSDK